MFTRFRWRPSLAHGRRLLSTHASGRNARLAMYASVGVVSTSAGYALAQVSQPATTKVEKTPKLTTADYNAVYSDLVKELGKDKVSNDEDDLHAHGFSENHYHPGTAHSVLVYPRTTADVVHAVKVANKYLVPIVPYSGGTNLEGHTGGAPNGGICIDLCHMDQIITIHEADSDIVCQPGAKWMDINAMLKSKGIPLFFPLDPAPGATVGGMLSTGCSGTNAVRYGTARSSWFLNATIVLPNGEVIHTRGRNYHTDEKEGTPRRARKSSAGWDVLGMFIGAEGTLGIVTEVTIRLAPLLPTNVAIAHFPDVQKATEASVEIVNQGAGIQCIELVDMEFMRATNAYNASGSAAVKSRQYPIRDSLFLKLQGPTPVSLQETANIIQKVVKKHGGTGFTLAKSAEEADEIWRDRKNAHYTGLYWGELKYPGRRVKGWSTDVCVPVSNLPKLVAMTKSDLESLEPLLPTTIVGHVGDGNFHALLLFDEESEVEKAVAKEAVHKIVQRALELDGTCTGEHGVGVGKREYLYEELGDGTIELMRKIKRTIDPHGLFNPGKLYPEPKGKGKE